MAEINPRATVISINLEKIEDVSVREALRALLRSVEGVSISIAKTANYNLARAVESPTIPDVQEGESVIWRKTGVGIGLPKAYLVTKMGGEVFTFPSDQLAGTIPVTPPVPTPPPPPPDTPGVIPPDFLDSFETSLTEGGKYGIHSGNSGDLDNPNRVTAYTPGRHGTMGVRLTTRAGDRNHGSGTWERCDLILSVAGTGGTPNQEAWWAFSVLFPTNFQMPQGGNGNHHCVCWQFHDSGGPTGLSPMIAISVTNHGFVERGGTPGPHVRLHTIVRDTAGNQHGRDLFGSAVLQRNVWYDFVHFVRWSQTPTGLFRLWGRIGDESMYRFLFDHQGATLYTGANAYLKPSNYHSNTGVESSVVYDRITRGPTSGSVALVPLEAVP